MFDPFRLSCLDYLIWLRSGQEATNRLACNQATVSRNAKSVADSLELDARKLEGEWTLGGDLSLLNACLLYTSPSPRDRQKSRMPSSA